MLYLEEFNLPSARLIMYVCTRNLVSNQQGNLLEVEIYQFHFLKHCKLPNYVKLCTL